MIKKIVFGALAIAVGVLTEKKLNLTGKAKELLKELKEKSDEWVDDDDFEEIAEEDIDRYL